MQREIFDNLLWIYDNMPAIYRERSPHWYWGANRISQEFASEFSLPHRASAGVVEPMLAKSAAPFDSDDHLFEIKWDGTRALCFVGAGGIRLMNRRRRDISFRYPDLTCLKGLPKGTVLDGESCYVPVWRLIPKGDELFC